MIIVTGASRGLGRVIGERLVSSGFQVLGIARSSVDAVYPIVGCDVSSFDDLKGIARQLRAEQKVVTGLINAAGVASMNLTLTTPASTARRLIDVNLLGTIFSCQVFAPMMIRQKHGTIINFSSIAVSLGLKGEAIYAASKAGVEAFSRSLAREVGSVGIGVNCLAPGPIDTDLLRGVSDSQISKIVQQQILRRQFTPEDVADLVQVILDPKFSSISGQVLNIGGA